MPEASGVPLAGTEGSNPPSSISESYTGDQRRATGLEALRCRGSDRRSLGACDGARLRFLPEEPTAVTPRGGKSQQWLRYPTKPHVRFCAGGAQ